jgi:ribosomal protein L3
VQAVDPDQNLLLVKGALPGPRGSLVLVRSAAKMPEPAKREATATEEAAA